MRHAAVVQSRDNQNPYRYAHGRQDHVRAHIGADAQLRVRLAERERRALAVLDLRLL